MKRFPLAALLMLWAVAIPAQKVDADTPVQALQEALIHSMKHGYQSAYAKRYQALAPVLRRSLDFPFIARLVTGRHWRTLSAEQQQQFTHAFAELSIATYLGQFKNYSGERFEITGMAPERGGRMKVDSLLHIGAQETVSFEYHLHRTQGRWSIINILAEGVSDLALKRAEYNRIFKDGGLASLMPRLKKQTREYEAQALLPD